jgi:hypothetical protein
MESEQRILNVLNLGAGVGSTTVYLLAHHGELPPIDAAVFADTQEEPQPVYDHLQWLLTLDRPKIHIATAGKLGDHLIAGHVVSGNSRKAGRFSSIPAFSTQSHEDREGDGAASACNVARVKRQCTKDYKVLVVERAIRRILLGLKPRQRIPRGVLVQQHFGLTDDEPTRIRAVKDRFAKRPRQVPAFPLAALAMTRADCVAYLAKHVPHETPRSACTFCPYRDAEGWLWLKTHDPSGWSRAVEIDRAIRDPAAVCGRGMRESLYLHRQCIPLEMVDLEKEAALLRSRRTNQKDLFSLLDADCVAGMCGV